MNNEREVIQERDTAFGTLAMIALAVCSLIAGFLPRNAVVAGAVTLIAFLLVWKDEVHLVFPFIIFYNGWYGMLFGMSVQRIFTILLLLLFLVRKRKTITLMYLAPLAVYFLYCAFVMTDYGAKLAVFSFVDVICCFILVSLFLSGDPFNLRRFFTAYVIAAVCAILTGMLQGNLVVYTTYGRFLATFEDPNYMGFFYTVAIFAMLSLRLFRTWIRAILIGMFYLAIIASASLSAVVVNVLLILLYVTITKRMRPSVLLVWLGVIGVLFALYSYGLAHPEENFIGTLSVRIQETIASLREGDLSAATTGRTRNAAESFAYFMESSFMKKLFGGTAVNTSVIDSAFRLAAHNEYIDMLLNVGVIGTVVLLAFFVRSTWTYVRAFYHTNNDHYLCLIMLKSIWALYGLMLTMFLDDRFLLLFFI